MLMRYAKLNWYKPTFRTPGYPLVPLFGLLGCLFVIVNTSRLSLVIGNLIIATSFVWYVLFLRKETKLEGASNILLRYKIIKPLMVRAEEYLAVRHEAISTILVPLANPETERSLLRVSTALAKQREARLHLIRVINVPRQTPLEAGRMEYEKRREEQETLLDIASRPDSQSSACLCPHGPIKNLILNHIWADQDVETFEKVTADSLVFFILSFSCHYFPEGLCHAGNDFAFDPRVVVA